MPKKILTGIIVSNKMLKTAVVEVESIKEHPKYRRRFKVHKRYKAQLDSNDFQVGDKVLVQECRPLSKDKKWKVIKKV
jgi:small subunit ribosomal protein S17